MTTQTLNPEITAEKVAAIILENLTENQLVSLGQKIYDNNIKDGYQPFGYDDRTLNITKPNELFAYIQVLDEHNRRI